MCILGLSMRSTMSSRDHHSARSIHAGKGWTVHGMSRGDAVLLYTDGITELQNSMDEMLAQDGLERAFGDGGNGPDEVIARLRAAVRAHQQDEPAADDQTLVAARAF